MGIINVANARSTPLPFGGGGELEPASAPLSERLSDEPSEALSPHAASASEPAAMNAATTPRRMPGPVMGVKVAGSAVLYRNRAPRTPREEAR